MKKILFLVALCLGAVAAQAQNHAVGIRFGGSVEFLYQHELSADNFLRFTVAVPDYDGVALTGTYNWHCFEWTDWTPKTCNWYLDAGVGGALGIYNFKSTGLLAGLVGSAAFGCHFKAAPISLEVDYRPVFGVVAGGVDKGFFKPGLWNFGLAVKFHF